MGIAVWDLWYGDKWGWWYGEYKVSSLFTVPSQIERSSVSVYRSERGSDDLTVLLTWTGLTSEQAGGVLTNYVISLYTIDDQQSTRTLVSILVVINVQCELLVEHLLCLVEEH